MTRLLRVYQVLSLGWQTILWPLGVLAIAFAGNLVLAGVLGSRNGAEGGISTGGLLSIYIVMFIGYLQIPTQYYPFALALGVTRRTFYRATLGGVIGEALAYGTLLYVLRLVEGATDGWGLELSFFRGFLVAQPGVVVQWLVYVVPFLVVMALGLMIGAVFKRWGALGLLVLGLVAAIAFGVATVLARSDRWVALGSYPPIQLELALGCASVVMVIVGWAALRRAAA